MRLEVPNPPMRTRINKALCLKLGRQTCNYTESFLSLLLALSIVGAESIAYVRGHLIAPDTQSLITNQLHDEKSAKCMLSYVKATKERT